MEYFTPQHKKQVVLPEVSTAGLDQSITALQSELTSVHPPQHKRVIDSFKEQVQDLRKREIASSLSELKQLLTSGNATAHRLPLYFQKAEIRCKLFC